MEDGAQRQTRLPNHPSKPGMGVNEAGRSGSDEHVMLGSGRFRDQDVTALDGAVLD